MATGKTTSQYITVSLNSQLITCSVGNIETGITYDEQDFTSFCNSLHEMVLGQGNVSIPISGPFNNTATTGGHIVVSALAGSQTGVPLVVSYGIRAAPTSGDPKFTVSLALVSEYKVQASGGPVTWSGKLIPGTGSTAAWGTV